MPGEKENFIRSHQAEIAPIADDQKGLRKIGQGRPVDPERIQSLLEQYETKVISYERTDANPSSSRILLEASQRANFPVVGSLFESLRKDERCGGMTLLTDSIAGKAFLAERDSELNLAPIASNHPVIADIPEGPYGSALVIDDAPNSPQTLFLHSAKSVFGAKKLYYLSLGLFGPVRNIIGSEKKFKNTDELDAVLVADELVKRELCDGLQVPEEKVIVTGSPLLDRIAGENASELRDAGRQRLGIAENTLAVAYVGFPSSALKVSQGGNPRINALTFEQTLAGVKMAALAEPGKQFAMVFRTHPASRNVEPPLSAGDSLPPNLYVVNGDGALFEEVVYAADIISCTLDSTESLLARYRGREAVIFAYQGVGQTGDILKRAYTSSELSVLKDSGRMTFVDSPEALSMTVRQYQARPALSYVPGSVNRIKDILTAPVELPSQ